MSLNRRQLLFLLGATTGAAVLASFPGCASAQALRKQATPSPAATPEDEVFKLPPLPYAYDALEPYIDAETMQFHHDKHHAAYTKKLNEAVNKYPELKTKSAEELIKNIDGLPEDIRTTVRNNGGGYVNHAMFWEIMKPNGGGEPTGAIAAAITSAFGSFAKFQEEFNKAGLGRFGSGWAWLVWNQGKLEVMSTPNQESPMMTGMYPVLGNDVWEHAYYLKYRNKRDEYMMQWWNLVNWDEVNRRFEMAQG
jgi:superoxide dismutase, Fe-Mn family